MKNRIYDNVKDILINHPACRDSDKKLIFNYWVMEGTLVKEGDLYYTTPYAFMDSTSSETIRRCRQEIQATHPELGPSEQVRDKRRKKEKDKGTFIFRKQGLV